MRNVLIIIALFATNVVCAQNNDSIKVEKTVCNIEISKKQRKNIKKIMKKCDEIKKSIDSLYRSKMYSDFKRALFEANKKEKSNI